MCYISNLVDYNKRSTSFYRFIGYFIIPNKTALV